MQRNLKFSSGEFYHIYNRGNDKQKIFRDKTDYRRFILLLYYANSVEPVSMRSTNIDLRIFHENISKKRMKDRGETLVDIVVWSLMPNHFHILIKEKVEGGISKFLLKLSTGYTMYFNKRYGRVGSLFQGAFKSEHLNEDRYLKYVFSYIHLNCLKLFQSDWKEKGIKDKNKVLEFLNQFEYSSYLDYLSDDRGYRFILNKKAFPEYFESVKDFKVEILEWINFKD